MSEPNNRSVHGRLKRQADSLENLALEAETRSSFSLNNAEEQELRELVQFLQGNLDELRLANVQARLIDVEKILRELKDDLSLRRAEGRPTRIIEAMVWEAENERGRVLASLSHVAQTPSRYLAFHHSGELPPPPAIPDFRPFFQNLDLGYSQAANDALRRGYQWEVGEGGGFADPDVFTARREQRRPPERATWQRPSAPERAEFHYPSSEADIQRSVFESVRSGLRPAGEELGLRRPHDYGYDEYESDEPDYESIEESMADQLDDLRQGQRLEERWLAESEESWEENSGLIDKELANLQSQIAKLERVEDDFGLDEDEEFEADDDFEEDDFEEDDFEEDDDIEEDELDELEANDLDALDEDEDFDAELAEIEDDGLEDDLELENALDFDDADLEDELDEEELEEDDFEDEDLDEELAALEDDLVDELEVDDDADDLEDDLELEDEFEDEEFEDEDDVEDDEEELLAPREVVASEPLLEREESLDEDREDDLDLEEDLADIELALEDELESAADFLLDDEILEDEDLDIEDLLDADSDELEDAPRVAKPAALVEPEDDELLDEEELAALESDEELEAGDLGTADPSLDDAELELELDDAELELDDAELELDDAELELDDAELELDDAEMELDDAELELDDAEMELDDAELELDDAELELDDAELELDDAELELNDAELDLEDDALDLDGEFELDDADLEGFDLDIEDEPSVETLSPLLTGETTVPPVLPTVERAVSSSPETAASGEEQVDDLDLEEELLLDESELESLEVDDEADLDFVDADLTDEDLEDIDLDDIELDDDEGLELSEADMESLEGDEDGAAALSSTRGETEPLLFGGTMAGFMDINLDADSDLVAVHESADADLELGDDDPDEAALELGDDDLVDAELELGEDDLDDAELELGEDDLDDAALELGEDDLDDAELELGEDDLDDAELELDEDDLDEAELELDEDDLDDAELELDEDDLDDAALELGEDDLEDADLELGDEDLEDAELELGDGDIDDADLEGMDLTELEESSATSDHASELNPIATKLSPEEEAEFAALEAAELAAALEAEAHDTAVQAHPVEDDLADIADDELDDDDLLDIVDEDQEDDDLADLEDFEDDDLADLDLDELEDDDLLEDDELLEDDDLSALEESAEESLLDALVGGVEETGLGPLPFSDVAGDEIVAPTLLEGIGPESLGSDELIGAPLMHENEELLGAPDLLGAPELEGGSDDFFSGPATSEAISDDFFSGPAPAAQPVPAAVEPDDDDDGYIDDLEPLLDEEEEEERLEPPSKEYRSSILEALRQVQKSDSPTTRADVLQVLESAVPKEYRAAVSERRRLVRLSCEYDVNCFQGNQIFHATIRDISLGGMKIEVTRQLESGTELQVSNPNRTEDEPDERIAAQVRWYRVKSDGKAEVGLQFVDPPEILGRSWVVSLLNKVGMQSQVFNQRKYTRASADFDIDIIDEAGDLYHGRCVDLGLGGALVDTVPVFQQDDVLTFRCQSFGVHGLLEAECRVVKVKHVEDEYGRYALEFDNLDAATTKLLGRYVVDLLKLGRGHRSS